MDAEVKAAFDLVNNRIDGIEKRQDKMEENQSETRSLALSVQKLAINLESMIKEQEKQGERLSQLEKQPAENWHTVVKTAVTVIVSALIGAMAAGLIK